MNIHKHNKKIALTLIFLLAGVSVVYGWRGWGSGAGCYYGDSDRTAAINLTEAQQKELNAAKDQFIADTADLRTELRAKTDKLDLLLGAAKPDTATIKALVSRISDVKASLMEKQVDYKLKLSEIAPELREYPSDPGNRWGMHGYGGRYHTTYHTPGYCWR